MGENVFLMTDTIIAMDIFKKKRSNLPKNSKKSHWSCHEQHRNCNVRSHFGLQERFLWLVKELKVATSGNAAGYYWRSISKATFDNGRPQIMLSGSITNAFAIDLVNL